MWLQKLMLHKSSDCPEFLEKRESLTSIHFMWILPTDVSGCDKNFSVLFELKLTAFADKISSIEENCLKIFSELGFSPPVAPHLILIHFYLSKAQIISIFIFNFSVNWVDCWKGKIEIRKLNSFLFFKRDSLICFSIDSNYTKWVSKVICAGSNFMLISGWRISSARFFLVQQ
jgi:hypothetical protein